MEGGNGGREWRNEGMECVWERGKGRREGEEKMCVWRDVEEREGRERVCTIIINESAPFPNPMMCGSKSSTSASR